MKIDLIKELQKLTEQEIVDQATADRIRNYYQANAQKNPNNLITIFAVIGACLIGLGIILILAHNWDQLSKLFKTVIAFTPLLIGQVLCFIALKFKSNKRAWTEASSAFLFFAIAICISLLSQIYNITGSLESFLLSWMLLALPLVYLMPSSIVAVFYLIGITIYSNESSYSFTHNKIETINYYYLLLLALLPFYYFKFKEQQKGENVKHILSVLHYLVPISLCITAGIAMEDHEELLGILYLAFFSFLLVIGRSQYFSNKKLLQNPYLLIGSVGSIVILLIYSFFPIWEYWEDKEIIYTSYFSSKEFFAILAWIVLSIISYYYLKSKNNLAKLRPINFTILIFFILLIVGKFNPLIATIAVNLIGLVMGIYTIRQGVQENHLGILNYGLIIITALIVCRFFDQDLSFVFRGILFMLLGAGFFMANYLMLQKRKQHEEY